MAMLWFYCDESYDNPTTSYCVAGLLGEADAFKKLQANWIGINDRFKVKRFHASELNAMDGVYEGWSKNQQVQYSKRMLKAIRKRGSSLQITSIAIEADSYNKILTHEAQAKLGHPYIVCFKTCLIMMATYMRCLPEEYKFSVIFERNEHATEAVRIFYLLKDHDKELGHRMGTCTPGSWDDQVPLQSADLIAYESMRWLKSLRSKGKYRVALNTLFGVTGSMGFHFDADILETMKNDLEASTVHPGNFFYTSKQFYPEFVEGDEWEDINRKVEENDRKRDVRHGNAKDSLGVQA